MKFVMLLLLSFDHRGLGSSVNQIVFRIFV